MDKIISEKIIELRPKLCPSSIKTYVRVLSSVYKSAIGNTNDFHIKYFDEKAKDILDDIKDKPVNSKKTILSALYVLTGNDTYKTNMLENIKAYSDTIAKQERTEKQVNNWVDKDAVEHILSVSKIDANHAYKKKVLTMSDLQVIQQYIIACLYSGKYLPPRRALDYVKLVLSNDKSKEVNYIDKNQFVFNVYKTSKFYGEQRCDIPKELLLILNKWKKHNPYNTLLIDNKGLPLSAVTLNQRLHKLFEGKLVGINQLRKTYLTGKYENTIKENDEMEKDMKAMGSSTSQSTTYIKRTDE